MRQPPPRNRARMLGCVVAAALAASLIPSCVRQARSDHAFAIAIRSLERAPEVRVLIAKGTDHTVAIDGPFRIESGTLREPTGTAAKLSACRPALSGTGVSLGGTSYPASRLLLRPETPETGAVRIDGVRYRGDLSIVRQGENLFLVNVLNLEWYVAGVVGGELPIEWPVEALRAQAVAARSYAHFMTSHRRAQGPRIYDLESTTQDQRYVGMLKEASERERRILFQGAVLPTEGRILGFAGELLCTYYHSTCGGRTEDAHIVHRCKSTPPLCGVRCPTCRTSPFHRWEAQATAREAASALEALGIGAKLGRMVRIEPKPPEEGRRLMSVRLVGTSGTQTVSASRFRTAVNTQISRRAAVTAQTATALKPLVHSNAFAATVQPDGSWRFTGRGWGHGSGMCQYGACGMARDGSTFADILAHYYPGSDLTKIY
ncbi:MAG: SpoIID/LytB domain-containing protein [Planctomycetes bacterium]|nr:SpoIID/LytB domain-containing protein [Planctomycetota bacterium]